MAGTVTYKMASRVRRLYNMMPDPKFVIAMGACTCGGGPYYKYGYNVVNEDLATAVLEEIDDRPEPVIMVHDYHLYLLPAMVRAARPDVFLHHFIHIPWTQPDAWRVLPNRIREEVFRGVLANDIVVVTSAPPTTLFLHRAIRARGAIGVYWLQDYYPQLIRGVWDAPGWLRRVLDRLWTRELRQWPNVVKAAGNLGYSGPNATVIRNWNTLELGALAPAPGKVVANLFFEPSTRTRSSFEIAAAATIPAALVTELWPH